MEDIKGTDNGGVDKKFLIQRDTVTTVTSGLAQNRQSSQIGANPQSRMASQHVAGVNAESAAALLALPKQKSPMNVCQWISLGILVLTFMFLLSFIIYQLGTWNKERINRYG